MGVDFFRVWARVSMDLGEKARSLSIKQVITGKKEGIIPKTKIFSFLKFFPMPIVSYAGSTQMLQF